MAGLTVIVIDPKAFGATREQVRLALEKENVESRPVWKPMHLQPVFAECPVRGGSTAQAIFDDGLVCPPARASRRPSSNVSQAWCSANAGSERARPLLVASGAVPFAASNSSRAVLTADDLQASTVAPVHEKARIGFKALARRQALWSTARRRHEALGS